MPLIVMVEIWGTDELVSDANPRRAAVADWLDVNGIDPRHVSGNHSIAVNGNDVSYCTYLRGGDSRKLIRDPNTHIPLVERVTGTVNIPWDDGSATMELAHA